MEVSGAESGLGLYLFEHDFRANAWRLSRRKTGIHFSGSCSSVRYRYRLPPFWFETSWLRIGLVRLGAPCLGAFTGRRTMPAPARRGFLCNGSGDFSCCHLMTCSCESAVAQAGADAHEGPRQAMIPRP